ncbi:OLC1v1007721C1 [Oldenlandia corymbosa var. corymbosa]|uniref:Mediator of RNA polymerase II transcription subunit 13 n=1 Tax=Oldenlandia corymbosa var. corymbosa TaxID=529605 RepID=A0AAV1DJV8_OLDCO|nr:OLC1v1007721C1 [Oldenlandia corymbosa var. corymbosa]
MWTNVFKIGGLHQISWFQFLPNESDLNSLSDKSVKFDPRDAATSAILSAFLQLQKEGFLSAWTNSFVGPWDPSQGLHNPDEKIKLWLFLPGNHSAVVEKAQPAVSKLRVLASGLWVAPGDSEEVAAALSHALRNCVERALKGFSFMRFGDVFSRHRPSSQSEELYRRGQPVAEFVFVATEEAIFVHAVISAKHIRALSSGDIEMALQQSFDCLSDRLPVITSPHGMLGKLTGCCPSDLVKQVYLSSGKFKASNEVVGLPYASHYSGCQLRGQNCYAEITLGGPLSDDAKKLHNDSSSQKNLLRHNGNESVAPETKLSQKGLPETSKMFIYTAEAVVVPVMQTSFARSSLKRFWLQNWIGPSPFTSSFLTHWLVYINFPVSCISYQLFINIPISCDFSGDGMTDAKYGSRLDMNGFRSHHGYHSSSNSNNSSISSISGSSSDSDYKTSGVADLDADADSLTCQHSGLSSIDQLHNDSLKPGSKRGRSGISEAFNQTGAVTHPCSSDFGSVEVNNATIAGGSSDSGGWGWDDDDRGMSMDIQALVSEFGDFGDFFENDVLPFGEPPGTAESQAPLLFPAQDVGDVGNSPSTSMMDVPDPMLLPVTFPPLESFSSPSAPPPAAADDSQYKNQNLVQSFTVPGQGSNAAAHTSGEFDHLIKAEAIMTFAPEYGAVETSSVEMSSSIFRSPYVPKSRKAETETSSSNNYIYSATPPSPCVDDSDAKSGITVNMRVALGKQDRSAISQSKNYYTHVDGVKDKLSRNLSTSKTGTGTHEPRALLSSIGFNSLDSVKSVHTRGNEGQPKAESFLPSLKPILATEVECLMCQAFMCRTRHVILSSSSPVPASLSRLSGGNVGNMLYQPSADSSIVMSDHLSSKSDVKKKETIPVRIAGSDLDGGLLDGPLSAPVGVWRSVPKGAKSTNHNMELSSSLPLNTFVEENILSYGLRQPLQELLDGLALLVQQATSFVDVALDSDCGDGAHGWLALQEQLRRGFCCGPSMVHAGCGGVLSSCHAVDIAGVELVDPLSVDVQPSFTIGLLQSDIKAALKSAFGTLDGPLSVIDWCKGRSVSYEACSTSDGFYAESTASASECRDSSGSVNLSMGEAISTSQSGIKDGNRMDETSERRSVQDGSLLESEQQTGSRLRPTLAVVPFPSILVGYQDDWLKTSANSLQVWEKAPLEPYATQKHMSYYVVCPDIESLTTATADFFQQLGTVYETCKLGTHSPHNLGNEMDVDTGKSSSSGFVLLDCPQSMKIDSSSGSILGSISDYFLSLSNGWDLESFLKSLSKVLKTLNMSSCLTTNIKDGNSSPFTVIYVVCPFPEPLAILRTVVEASIALGSSILSSDKEKRSMMHNQVGKALNHSAAVDEALSNVFTISGFSIPKLVLQIVTVDAIFRVTNPPLSELVVLKEIAFTVYNKARRVSRGVSGESVPSSTSLTGRSHPVSMQMTSSLPGMWKDCVGPRLSGSSLHRESDLDASLRSNTWDSSWQARAGGLGCDPSRAGDFLIQDEVRCMFEPLFILAEPGSLERGVSPLFGNLSGESSKVLADDGTSGSSGIGETGQSSQHDASEPDGFGCSNQKTLPSLHCCYGWTEDWRWLVCIWTDSRGELLDSYIYPFGGISSRQDTKGLQSLFVQIIQQGCRILQACSSDGGKPRDFVIARIGCFFELESQEWQKALYSIGGPEMKKWSLQLRRSVPDGMTPSSNGGSMQQQDMSSLLQERTLPSSPSPLYSPHTKSSAFMKSSLGQTSSRKQLMGGGVDSSRGLLQWVQSISFVSVSVDHSLQLVFQADSITAGSTQINGFPNPPNYLEGYTPVRSLGSASACYMFIPSPSIRFLPPAPLQLPTCLTAESPPLAHLLHSKGSAIPLCTGFAVSKAVPSMRKDSRSLISKEEWPSVLSISLVDYYGGSNVAQERMVKGIGKAGGRAGLSSSSESRDFEQETHLVLETVSAELHALSWMTVSPAYLERRTALPFHCDMVLRLRRLLHFADKELSRQPEQPQS